ncbi:hypothetical protein E2C01_021989 [Portunus trituberculatus]|uniref:Uncharacterized protein n=1 Tax=Portunus trituberculatus TaxID=210409 RepID=A0A5B7E4V1_PORTR|nr:hypothetical protein [Portunus trituberculatus]
MAWRLSGTENAKAHRSRFDIDKAEIYAVKKKNAEAIALRRGDHYMKCHYERRADALWRQRREVGGSCSSLPSYHCLAYIGFSALNARPVLPGRPSLCCFRDSLRGSGGSPQNWPYFLPSGMVVTAEGLVSCRNVTPLGCLSEITFLSLVCELLRSRVENGLPEVSFEVF